MLLKDAMRCELPAQGITLPGYVVEQIHKTQILASVPRMIVKGRYDTALKKTALYATAVSTSLGRAYGQPDFSAVSHGAAESDPATGALVSTKLEAEGEDG